MKLFRNGYWQKVLIALIFLAQLIAVLALFVWLIDYAGSRGPTVILHAIALIFAADIALSVYIISTPSPDVYKISWLFLVYALPIGGALIYILFANKQTNGRQRKKLKAFQAPMQQFPTEEGVLDELDGTDHRAHGISKYLEHAAGGGVHKDTQVTYFPLVDYAFEPILEELRKAKHFIFLEFFIVAPGKMWDSMLEILKEKAAQGVDVRLLYDDVGSLATAPYAYAKTLEKMGIKTVCYNPLRPLVDIRLNNRDHRKILVIDGHTCFSGGFNLADEYINAEVRFGHWKDNAILIKGRAVGNFTHMFLANWYVSSPEKSWFRLEDYDPERYIDEIGGFPSSDGFVQPYGYFPFDREAVGERVYLDIINSATRYVYMTTPYLIIDKEMENAMIHAARRGVDVRLLTPHIPDKGTVFSLTRSMYGPLISGGVKVYEYTPGFVHAKTFVSDDMVGTVGTINMDYRSLYLHLECGTFLCNCSCIKTMKDDYLETLGKSHEITKEQWNRWRGRQFWYWAILRILAPFL